VNAITRFVEYLRLCFHQSQRGKKLEDPNGFVRRFIRSHAEGNIRLSMGKYTLASQRDARWQALKGHRFDA
jgi:hypothetical protein